MEELYNPEGIYKYTNGFNIYSLAAFFLGIIGEYVISALQGNLQIYFGFLPVPGIELAWYFGFFISMFFQLIFGLVLKNYMLPELRYKRR